jgi:hypothetical protein
MTHKEFYSILTGTVFALAFVDLFAGFYLFFWQLLKSPDGHGLLLTIASLHCATMYILLLVLVHYLRLWFKALAGEE